MFKKISLLCLTLMSSTLLNAQNNQSKEYQSKLSATEVPSQEWNDWFNQEVEKFEKNLQTGKVNTVNYTIPVIFHIIHTNQNVGTFPNLDTNQIKSQIKVLNKDFAGTGFSYTNCPAPFANLISNTGIKFCLARLNPNNVVLAERGIVRINANNLGWQNPSTPTLNLINYMKTVIIPATIWDPTRYLNIWVSDKPASQTELGFATYPAGTNFSGGFPSAVGTASTDGIWCWGRAVGDTLLAQAPNHKGRIITREVGHWLGLRNLWGDGNCLTDYCNDTPWAKQANTGCPPYPSFVNRCGLGQSPDGEMTMNFMDETDDSCKYMFTPRQTIRMQTAMSQGTYRNALGLNTNLCAAVTQTPQAPNAGFYLNDVPCLNVPFTPINTSSGWPTPTYQWNSSPAAGYYPSANVAQPSITFNSTASHTLYLTVTNSVNISTYSLVIPSVTVCPAEPLCLDTIQMIKTIDTLTTYFASTNSLVLGCQTGYVGYLTGSNCFKDKEFAQFIPANTFNTIPFPQVNSVIVLFDANGTKPTNTLSPTQISCKLYGGTVGAGPSSQFAIKSDSLVKIAASTKTNTIKYCGTPNYTFTTSRIIPYKFDFAAPIPLTPSIPGFFAAIETPYLSLGDSINIFTNTKTNTSNDSSSWVLQNATNNWRTMRYLKNSKIQLAILPQITCRPVVGINENISVFNSNVAIIPNPSNGVFNLIFTLPKQENISVKIHNAIGQQISGEHLENVSNNMVNVDLSNRPEGIYFVEISNGSERVVKKIIISR